MELMAAILLAGPLGYLTPSRRRGLVLYLLVWAVVLPIQTVAVHNTNPDHLNWQYPIVNAVILAAGVALNRLGAAGRARRRSRRPA
jgi:peptidoglycan/LPS O-acetylase OafA/YrhL